MKTVGLILFTGMMILSSCKKDWSCNCTNGNGAVPIESYSGLTKKDAQSKCDNVQKDFQEFNANLTCEIEKK